LSTNQSRNVPHHGYTTSESGSEDGDNMKGHCFI
jgi:hypothetical protein